ncbi:hypothetical protein CM240_0647 [Clostridium bornimense]|uniref:Uncharacterized protein n=1 Tax=Clostridium bornimense TaxID=1216932 RepID=W6S0K0_9CLOT|nr:AAA family ATPase [Clostridium bornimense]CDM67812.1 hypothetical protein CM240_0647 [Clostridium bornimense]
MSSLRWEVDYNGVLVWREAATCSRNRGEGKTELIRELFERDGWTCQVIDDSSKFVKISLSNPNFENSVIYNVALVNVVNEYRNRSDDPESPSSYEKRIQGQDFSQYNLENKLVLGLYVIDSEEDLNNSIIVSWPKEILTDGSNRAYRVNTKENIQPARVFGLYADKSSAYNVVTFKPQNIHIYLKNRDALHRYDAPSIEENAQPEGSVDLQQPVIDYPHNRIIFGAPGTGKSFKLDKDKSVFGDNYERVTFHPNYSYSQFVGSYKPKPKKNGNGDEYVSYEFVPGPFLRTWVNAQKSLKDNDGKSHLLIIEEINRANVAAVFGDVFQLLDRKADGTSEYEISTTEDMRKYLIEEHYFTIDEVASIKLPNNMYIWATMNSADQGVTPVDSAFKRRWHFEYIGINECMDEISEKEIDLKPYGRVNWNQLRLKINDRLTQPDLNINEDKLIGPFFLSEKELESNNIDLIFKSKLLMYLYEDVLKHRKGKLFRSDLNTLSKVFEAYDKGENVFDFELTSELLDNSEDITEQMVEQVNNMGNE